MKKIIEDKRFLVSYIVVIFALVLGVSYALGADYLGINIATATISADSRLYGKTKFDSSKLDFRPILDTEVETKTDNVVKIDFTVGGASTNDAKNIIYDIALVDLSLDCNLISPYVKWKLIKDGIELSNGSLAIGIKNKRLVLTENQEDLPSYNEDGNGYHEYTFYMWLSDSCQGDITTCADYTQSQLEYLDQSNLLGKYFSGKIEVELYTGKKKGYGPMEDRADSDTSACTSSMPVMVNAPNLDNGNLIPVYYDDGDEVWKKANSSNKNYSWYNYENKRWANAIIKDQNTIVDLSNNLNNATNVNATWNKTKGTIKTDGSSTYVNCGMENYDFGNSITYAIKVKFNELKEGSFFGNWNNTGGGGLFLYERDEIKLGFELYIESTDYDEYITYLSNFSPKANTWYSIVATFNGVDFDLYVNGERVDFEEDQGYAGTQLESIEAPDGTEQIMTSNMPFVIGGIPNKDSNSNFTGIKTGSAMNITIDSAAVAKGIGLDVGKYYEEGIIETDGLDLVAYYDFSSDDNIPIGTALGDSEADGTLAFYVWIPRYKYRVWNITRQGGEESTYAYKAYSKGIEIEFESGTASTGNVKCTYDVTTAESVTNLSDKCYYNGSSTAIATTDSNTNYTDAWYTHPAFTFNGEALTGFWIGKFETSTDTTSACYTSPSAANCDNYDLKPRILPDVSSLRHQRVAYQFRAARKFQDYLSYDINAHMLTNLEWGAVAYLTHSIYGLCNGTTCDGIYQNNSAGYYTGRSGGSIAGLVSPSEYGNYTYKGYLLTTIGGTITTTKDTAKIASTTRNITGVYDMSGGSYEYVMGNMVDASYNFYPSGGDGEFTVNPGLLESFYYNAYSYGTNSNNAIAFNRARLGDATAEILGGTYYASAWKPGSGISGSISYFLDSTNSWFARGGYYNSTYSGVFLFYSYTGNSFNYYSFRSSLS